MKISVLVDLHYSADAGGHVKCWQKLARSAALHADSLDLTVHFLGPEGEVREKAPNVRYRFHAPALGTDRFPFLSGIPDHTDLARVNRSLLSAISGADVLHTTMIDFAFTRTAERLSSERGIPLVNSMHTDLPGCGRVFGAHIITRVFGKNLSRPLLDGGLRLDQRIERNIEAKVLRHQKKCFHVLVSKPADYEAAVQARGGNHVSFLRRGIDTGLFTHERRDRQWLREQYGIPETDIVIVFAGRLNLGKNVRMLAAAVSQLAGKGLPVRLFCAGDGEDRGAIMEMLGDRARCPGILDQHTLAGVYASADLFASPSKYEVLGNVMLEALSSGLPVLIAEESGMGRLVIEGETGRVLGGDDPQAWVGAIGDLVRDANARGAMAGAARAYAEHNIPTWDDVLTQDLLPVWRKAAGSSTSRGRD